MKRRLVLAAGLCAVMMLPGIHAYAASDETKMQQAAFHADGCGVVFVIPDEYQSAKGTVDFIDYGDTFWRGDGVVEMSAMYYPWSKADYERMEEEEAKAEDDGDLDTALDIIMKMNGQNLFDIYGINKDRGKEELIDYLVRDSIDPEKAKARGVELTPEVIGQNKEKILSRIYTEIGSYDGFTYVAVTEDPEPIREEKSYAGFEDAYYEEFLSFLENTDVIRDSVEMVGGVILTDPVKFAEEGTRIEFETTDLDGDPVRSEDLFAGHSITMINLWGTWCGPCKRELPELEALNHEIAEKGCQIIGIVTDALNEDKISQAKDILAEKGVTYMNLAAFDGLADVLPQEAYPTSYFVDENGNIIGAPIAGAYIDQYRERLK